MSELVSIVIPVYNAEKYLRASIESALAQTYSNIEIICIDDGSTDKSLELLKQYSNKIIIISQKNQGLSSALNIGIQQMKGKWFKWFSPDDILHPNAIETLVKNANQLPDNTIIYSNWNIIDEKGKILRSFFEHDYNSLSNFDFNVRLLSGQQINVNTTLIPTSLFESGCIMRNLDNPAVIDYDFFLRSGILYNTKFHLDTQHLIDYRIHNSQLSHKNIISILNHAEKITDEILLSLKSSDYQKYKDALKIFNDEKKISKKFLELGLKIIKKILPPSLSDPFLLFYLNKIRHTR